MSSSLDLDLPGCNNTSCPSRLSEIEKMPFLGCLNNICNHLGSNLKTMVIRDTNECDHEHHSLHDDLLRYVAERDQGITVCTIYKTVPPAVDSFEFYWPAEASESSLVQLMKRTVSGQSPIIGFIECGCAKEGSTHSAKSRSLPSNCFKVLSLLATDGIIDPYTHLKIKSLGSFDLNNCMSLEHNSEAPIEDEEIHCWESILD